MPAKRAGEGPPNHLPAKRVQSATQVELRKQQSADLRDAHQQHQQQHQQHQQQQQHYYQQQQQQQRRGEWGGAALPAYQQDTCHYGEWWDRQEELHDFNLQPPRQGGYSGDWTPFEVDSGWGGEWDRGGHNWPHGGGGGGGWGGGRGAHGAWAGDRRLQQQQQQQQQWAQHSKGGFPCGDRKRTRRRFRAGRGNHPAANREQQHSPSTAIDRDNQHVPEREDGNVGSRRLSCSSDAPLNLDTPTHPSSHDSCGKQRRISNSASEQQGRERPSSRQHDEIAAAAAEHEGCAAAAAAGVTALKQDMLRVEVLVADALKVR